MKCDKCGYEQREKGVKVLTVRFEVWNGMRLNLKIHDMCEPCIVRVKAALPAG